jgi:pimeloyl-ACP methyl ester carboxylesterase
VILHGGDDAVAGWPSEREVRAFPALRARRIIPGAGHFMPREAPNAVVDAIRDVLR